MRRSICVLLALALLLAVPALGEGPAAPVRVRYVPAPAEVTENGADCVFAATPDGRFLLAGGRRDLWIWDTREAARIELSFAGTAERFEEDVRQTAQALWSQQTTLPRTQEEYQAWQLELAQTIDEVAAAGGAAHLQTFAQARAVLPSWEPNFTLLAVGGRYAVMFCRLDRFVVDMTTGLCSVPREPVGGTFSYVCGGRVLNLSSVAGTVSEWDPATGQITPVETRASLPDMYARALCEGPEDGLWIIGPDYVSPVTDEEWAAYALNFADGAGRRALRISLPYGEVASGLVLWSGMIDRAMATADGRHVLVASSLMPILFAVVDTVGGTARWFPDSSPASTRDLSTEPLKPLAALADRFVCWRPSDEQFVLLDPETGALTPLAFSMRSEALPLSYREPGRTGTRAGEVWTTVTPVMLRETHANEAGMIFAWLPGYYVVE